MNLCEPSLKLFINFFPNKIMKWALLEGTGQIPSKTICLTKMASQSSWQGLGFHHCLRDLETQGCGTSAAVGRLGEEGALLCPVLLMANGGREDCWRSPLVAAVWSQEGNEAPR